MYIRVLNFEINYTRGVFASKNNGLSSLIPCFERMRGELFIEFLGGYLIVSRTNQSPAGSTGDS